jgi:hypothetical protein
VEPDGDAAVDIVTIRGIARSVEEAGVIPDHGILFQQSLTKHGQVPGRLSVGCDFERRDTWPRATVRARYAAGIKEEYAFLALVARQVGVSMQEDIHVLRHARWWNVNEAKADAVSFQIDDQRPLEIAVTVAAHHRHRRSNVFQSYEQAGRANIAEMPDFVCAFRQCLKVVREMIVRIGENKNP